MLTAFFDMHETVHHKLIPQTQTFVQIFYSKMCGKNDLRSGTMEIGSTIITMLQYTLCLCRNFWPIMAWLLTCTLWTLDVGPWVFFFFSFSQNWRWCWEEGDFMTSAWFKNGRLRFQSSEHRMLQNAFKNDTITRLTEFSCKGITLKGTEWNSMWMMLPLKKVLTGNFLITLCIFSLQKFTCLHILCNYHLLVKDCLRGNIWGI